MMMQLMNVDTGLRGQIVRYAISGGALTIFYSVIYWVGAVPMGIEPLIANTVAFLGTVVLGFVVHSRWSFRDHGSRDRPGRAWGMFLLVNVAGFALNSFWVWSIVEYAGGSPSLPLIPIVLITPWLSFYLNRRWTFGN